MKSICIIISFLLITACSLLEPQRETMSQSQMQMLNDINEATRLNITGEGRKALAILKPMRSKAIDLPNYRSYLYQLGEAQLQSQHYIEAEGTFREFLNLAGSKSDDEARALYKLAFCYEGLGQDQNAIAALLDLQRRPQFKNHPEWRSEIPVRMAGAYLRTGNTVQAAKLYNTAEAEFASVRRLWSRDPVFKDRLGELLFNMGNIAIRELNPEDLKRNLAPLQKAQKYLVQALESGSENWSNLAASTIKKSYDHALEIIEKIQVGKSEDETLSQREKQEQQKSSVEALSRILQELKRSLLQRQDVPPRLFSDLKLYIKELEQKLDKIYTARPIGEGLTPESESREGIKRKGTLVNP